MNVARQIIPLLLMLAAACKQKEAQGPAPSSEPGVAQGGAVIGACLSLTGAAASYGAQQRAGIQAAADDVNQAGATRLDIRIEDDASAKEQGITVFQKFINRDKVNAITRPTLSNTATAPHPLAQQAGVPGLGASNTPPRGIHHL